MPVIDETLQANAKYSADFNKGALPLPPARHVTRAAG